ncbi:MAG TPA: glycosyltransferase [Xanthobacteraceae bacterium]|jgi:spore maturation protein CgeB
MKFVLFYHSLVSCWNHGNAHFLRGISRELIRLGHQVTICEPANGWSRRNALTAGGAAVLAEAAGLVPGVHLNVYDIDSLEPERVLDGADVVIVHEWNETHIVAKLGEQRSKGGRFLLLFHDTHHRAVTAAQEISRFPLEHFDAILAFGEVLRQVYLDCGWGRRAFTWHEAADVGLFKPHPEVEKDGDAIWIGNWGDGERDRELHDYLVRPVLQAGLKARLYGVRYPQQTIERLSADGFEYGGWLPNHRVPRAFARARMTMHIPRRPYVDALTGIPTIRVFEALACGIPLVCAPWDDTEGLFPEGSYLKVRSGEEATAALRLLAKDRTVASHLAASGLQAIAGRHTCGHRAQELLAIIRMLRPGIVAARGDLPRELIGAAVP